ncbi:hypothetical protein X474_11840 [Dethiosulfatarculus sandiegensis]|uniref:Uncharacterized protein n=1 Tax=Dethiosulfatarculus sandiegensis TaxID=1429043 RepID=A0A0D2GG40_9BACT|nr:hypothetical protein X474_11840 [Dethiosulfatarculus sandiegensis]
MRNLALRSAEAAKNTSVLILENQNNPKAGSEVLEKTDSAFFRVSREAEGF